MKVKTYSAIIYGEKVYFKNRAEFNEFFFKEAPKYSNDFAKIEVRFEPISTDSYLNKNEFELILKITK